MIGQLEYEECLRRLNESHEASLREHDAYDMVAGENFVGYLRRTSDGFEIEPWSWGSKKNPIRGATEKEIADEAFRIFDGR